MESSPRRSVRIIGVEEASKANEQYWQMVEYRYRRIAKFMFLGYLKNQIYARDLLQNNPGITEAKQAELVKYLNDKLLFSKHLSFTLIEKNKDQIKKELNELGVTAIDDARLTKLLNDMKRLRGRWSKEIESDHLTSRFIKETTLENFDEFVRPIKEAKWDQIQFQPEFKLNLYKAYRLGKITTNELIYGEILFSMSQQYKGGKIQYYSFLDEKGPYSPRAILNMTDEKLRQFQKTVPDLPVNQQGYATVDFSRKYEIAYFYLYLVDEEAWETYEIDRGKLVFFRAFPEYLKRIAARNSCSEETLQKQYALLEELKAGYFPAKQALADFVLEQEKDLKDFLLDEKYSPDDNLHLDNAFHLIMNFHSNEQIPLLAVRPFDPTDPNRSIVSRILPSPAAFQNMEHTLFPQEATNPVPIAGRLTTRKMKEIDVKSGGKARTLEANPPGVRASDVIHDSKSLFAEVISHDHYFHCYRSSTTPFKALNVYLIDLVQRVMHTGMNKFIFQLVDKPDSALDVLMAGESHKKTALLHYLKNLLFPGWRAIYEGRPPPPSDLQLVLYIDCINNRSKWNELLAPVTVGELFSDLRVNSNLLLKIREAMPNQSITFYVTAYHAMKDCLNDTTLFNARLQFLKKTEDNMGLHQIIKWRFDGELTFNPNLSYLDSKLINFSYMNGTDVFSGLVFSVNNYKPPKSLQTEYKTPEFITQSRQNFDLNIIRYVKKYYEMNKPRFNDEIKKFIIDSLAKPTNQEEKINLMNIQFLQKIEDVIKKLSQEEKRDFAVKGIPEEKLEEIISLCQREKPKKLSIVVSSMFSASYVKLEDLKEIDCALKNNLVLSDAEREVIRQNAVKFQVLSSAVRDNLLHLINFLESLNIGLSSLEASQKNNLYIDVVQHSAPSALKYLLDREPSMVNFVFSYPYVGTLLNIACKTGNIENIKILCESKANINATDCELPLQSAMERGQLSSMSTLLSLGANPLLLKENVLENRLQTWLKDRPDNTEIIHLMIRLALFQTDDPTKLENYLSQYSAALREKLLFQLPKLTVPTTSPDDSNALKMMLLKEGLKKSLGMTYSKDTLFSAAPHELGTPPGHEEKKDSQKKYKT